MSQRQKRLQARAITVIDGVMAMIVVLLLVQMWLMTTTLETFLAGHLNAVAPAAVWSGLLFLCCLGLSLFIQRLDASISIAPPERLPPF